MTRANITIFLILAIFFGVSPVLGQAAGGSGSTAVAGRPAEINFGDLRLGSTRDTVFYFNVEGTPVVITDTRVDCVCTKVRWDKRPIAAGSRGTLGITYRAKEVGLFYKTINVTLSDPGRSFRIIVRGRVVK